jgi:type II secretory pathway component PulJ
MIDALAKLTAELEARIAQFERDMRRAKRAARRRIKDQKTPTPAAPSSDTAGAAPARS